MESSFKVRITPRKMVELFENSKYTVKFYEFLGINSEGDFYPEICTDEEWNAIRDTECLFSIHLRHEELPSYLREGWTYKSWKHVEAAIRRRKKKL